MNIVIGKVIEIYIPEEYKNGQKIDIMNSSKIGFKIKIDDKILDLVQEQDENNTLIFKNDLVIIRKQTINNKEFIDIEKYNGDNDE